MSNENLSAEESKLLAKLISKYKKAPYRDLAIRMQELATQAKFHDDQKKVFTAELDLIRLQIVPERFANDDMTSMNITGVGRLGLTSDMHCNVSKDKKTEFHGWLHDNEFGDLIKPDVNPSSLKSLIKELRDSEDEGEQEKYEKVQDYVKIHPFMRASITKI